MSTNMNTYKERNMAYGAKWLDKFALRASSVVAEVLGKEEVKDHTLFVNVYIPQMGIVPYLLWDLLSDPTWDSGAEADERGMCEVLENTFLSATIYVALEKMSLCVDYF
jgi:hypothetical protein